MELTGDPGVGCLPGIGTRVGVGVAAGEVAPGPERLGVILEGEGEEEGEEVGGGTVVETACSTLPGDGGRVTGAGDDGVGDAVDGTGGGAEEGGFEEGVALLIGGRFAVGGRDGGPRAGAGE